MRNNIYTRYFYLIIFLSEIILMQNIFYPKYVFIFSDKHIFENALYQKFFLPEVFLYYNIFYPKYFVSEILCTRNIIYTKYFLSGIMFI